MRIGQLRLVTALGSLCMVLLAGCGGGGSGSPGAAMQVVPPALGTPAPSANAPVTYFQNSGSLTTSGTIVAGAHQALVAIMSGASSASSFASDSLSVSTPATAQSAMRTASAARSVAPPRVAPVEAFAADDRELISRVQMLARSAGSAAVRRAQSVLPAALTVGTSAPIWVQKGALSGSRTNVQVPAQLVAQTQHANIWIDSTLSFTQSQIAQIETDFENAYASDTAHFASPDYSSNAPGLQPRYTSCAPGGASQGTSAAYITEPADRRIDVMVVNSSNLGGLGGYFSAANLMTQSTLNCLNGSGSTYESNEAPFIFVGWFAGSGATYELQEDLVRSTAHELQHLINFVNHGILASGASSSSWNGNEAPYINEGLSMLAQDFAVAAMYGSHGVKFDADDALARANVYLAAPSNFSLSAFSGVDPASWGGNADAQYNCGGGCYGAAYLFERYLADRFGGDAYTHAMETGGVTGGANLQSATGESASSLFGDFALAMAADSLNVSSSDARFRFGSLSLSGSYTDQFGAATTLGGLYAQTFSGGSATVNAPVGGFAFVSMGSVPASGTAVSVSDRATASGFSLEGGLAQK
ncbi:MAG TPA: hypothetical protein VJP85_13095 [Candidatus Baltobacteraceae bacterium]|nr:hypothetical protein [Candidatus Baltobacteraceae bacterium]